jgi:DNA-binding beta-propeller fold protein YncE
MRLSAAVILALAVLPACGSDDGGAGPSTCDATPFAAQPIHRFPVGGTYLLPVPTCAGSTWTLAAAPAGNANAPVLGADDGITRFTPHLAGEYRFTRGDDAVTLTAVDAGALPFHQLNYYPTRSLALVDGALWVAGVYAPAITALDPASGATLATISVGGWPVAIAWREGMAEALVAQRATDSLGVVDVAARRIVDAIHVGDEPANVVVSPDGATAYVALAVSGRIAVVDVAARRVRATVTLAPDLQALALSPDGARLYAARHRSGHPDRYPYPADPVAEERDVFVVDTASLAIVRELVDVGTTIQWLEVSADGTRLFMSGQANNTYGTIAQDSNLPYVHRVVVFDTTSFALVAEADLSRQDGSAGPVTSLHGLVEAGGALWVAVEGNDELVALDPLTLAELARVPARGRPRALLAAPDGDALFAHGAQSFVVTGVDPAARAVVAEHAAGADPRPPAVAEGQRIFTRAGRAYGRQWACNGCHADAKGDTLVWNAGPVVSRMVSRPLFWLEGTAPLGWDAYMSSPRNFAYEGGSTTGWRPVTEESEALAAYLATLAPPPAANDFTARDGALSPAAERGRALFGEEAGCVTCHVLPLGTSNETLDEGATPGRTSIPSIVGAYRHGTWLKDGGARDLRAAVQAMVDWQGVVLTAEQVDDVTAYLRELTGRDFFVLASAPRRGEQAAAVDQRIVLSLSLPAWGDAQNLARVELRDGAGALVPATVTAEGLHVVVTPTAPLAHDADYELVVPAALESFDERAAVPARIAFHTARAPSIRLDGAYRWTVQVPGFNPMTGDFDPVNTVPVDVAVTATPTMSGATLVFDHGDGLAYTTHAVIDGDVVHLGAAPVPTGPSFSDGVTSAAVLLDDDGDGLADGPAGGAYTMSGPGFRFEDLPYTLAPPAVGCPEGASGAVEVEVEPTAGGGSPTIRWSGPDDGLALYVTAPGATLPMGPGMTVQNGTTYWGLQAAMFPTGFADPVTYGVVPDGASDVTAQNGGTLGPLQSGVCYQFSVITTGFVVGSRTILWP